MAFFKEVFFEGKLPHAQWKPGIEGGKEFKGGSLTRSCTSLPQTVSRELGMGLRGSNGKPT